VAQCGSETHFKILRTTRLGRVSDAYAKRNGIERSDFRLMYDGERVDNFATPDSLGMESDDIIEVVRRQTGSIGIFVNPEEQVFSTVDARWNAAKNMPGAQWLESAAGPTSPPAPEEVAALALAVAPDAAFCAVDEVTVGTSFDCQG
jgi:small ubiquitin-related modifier